MLTLVVTAFAVGSMAAANQAGWYFAARKARALGRHTPTKDTPYECGMLPIGDGAPRFSVKFYLVAMLFVIFDIEVVFMYPWAVQFKELILTNSIALLSMACFVAVLGVAYLYVLKKGALNWKA